MNGREEAAVMKMAAGHQLKNDSVAKGRLVQQFALKENDVFSVRLLKL